MTKEEIMTRLGEIGNALSIVLADYAELSQQIMDSTDLPPDVPPPPAVGAPTIISYTALPSTIKLGENSLLTWLTEGVKVLTVNGNVQAWEKSGSLMVYPTETTEYTLEASNDSGLVAQSLTVTVSGEPTPPDKPPVEPPPDVPPIEIPGDLPAATVIVKAGSSAAQVQSAFDSATVGDVIRFEPGSYDGDFRIKTARVYVFGVPGKTIFRKQAGGQFGALDVRAPRVTLRDFDVTSMSGLHANSLITVGDIGATDLAALPVGVSLIGLRIYGDPKVGCRRGVQFAAGKDSLIDSCQIYACFDPNDAQGIWSHIGGGWVIRNCDIQGAAQCIMFGGSPSNIAGHTMSDILITGCKLHKPSSWPIKSLNKYIVELKRGINIRIVGNELYDIQGGVNGGCAIGITERTEGGRNPWAVMQDILIEDNLMYNVGKPLTTLGKDNNSKPTKYLGSFKGLIFRNNLCICTVQSMYLMTGVEDVQIIGNTVVKTGLGTLRNGVYLDSPPMTSPTAPGYKADWPIRGLTMRRNIIGGPFLGRGSVGDQAIAIFAPGADVSENLFSSGAPSGNEQVKMSAVLNADYSTKRPGYGSTLKMG